ncbi:MAG: cell division protein ZapA [Nitrospira sp.]|nr:cell division protein ZapA [Nitrospira sp.]
MIKTIEVEIYGQRYAIRGDADDVYIRRLALFVEDQMKRLAGGMKTATPAKLAVLTAINLAHQLFESEKKRAQGEADVDRRMETLMESIEEQISTSLFR